MALRLLSILIYFSTYTYSQSVWTGTYTPDGKLSANYLELLESKKFNYAWAGHMTRDSSSGTYLIKNDTIILRFRKYKLDTIDHLHYIETVALIEPLGAIGRPDSLFLLKDKLYPIINGRVFKVIKKRDTIPYINMGEVKLYRKRYLLFGPSVRKRTRVKYLRKVQ